MEKEIPTAEEYLASKQYDWVEDINTTECMIEFAKLHVEKALKAASENTYVKDDDYTLGIIVDKESILNSYPLENIK